MIKFKRKIVVAVLNFFACIILLVCLGLAVVSGPFLMEEINSRGSFFYLLDRYGTTIAFISMIFFLMILYVHQKILFETQKGPAGQDGAVRSFGKFDLRVRQIFEFLPIGVIETTRAGKIVFCNPMASYLFGFPSTQKFMETVNGDDDGINKLYVNGEVRDRMVKRLYEERADHCKFQDRFYCQNSQPVDLAFELFLRYDAERDEECIFGFIQDVTERVAFERKLQASETRYRELIDKANSIVLRLDASGQIKYMNDFGRRFFGFSMEDVHGRPLWGTIFDKNMLDESSANAIVEHICKDRDDAALAEMPTVKKGGRQIWISWSHRAMMGEDGRMEEVLLIGTDITDRKEQEQLLKEQLAIETILEQISFQLANIGIENPEQAIRFSLDKIKDFFEASSVYSCFFSESGFIENFYTCSLERQDEAKVFIEHFFLSATPWWLEKLERSGFVLFSDIEEIPDEAGLAKQTARDSGIERVLVTPIFHHNRLVGFIGLNAVCHEPIWHEQQISLTKSCGEMFLNLLEKKKYHDAIAEAKERFDVAVCGAYLGMYDWDIPSGKVIFNDIWFRMLGYSPHELPHTVETWKALLHPNDTEKVLTILNDYLKGTSTFYSAEFRLKTKDGSWKWILGEGSIKRRDADGSPLKMIGLHRDVTELKMAELELRHQKDIVESLIENMPAGIFAKDVKNDFRFLIWNRRMEELFGLKRHDVLGKTDYELFSRELADLYLKDDREVVQQGRIKDKIHERIHTVKGERWVQTVKVPVFSEEGDVQIIFGILDDITEKEELEMSLRQSQKMQAIGQLAAGVAHEVKNPLAIILLAAEGLEMSREVADNERIQNKVEMIKTASKKANKVILELLKFSRLADTEMDYIDLHKVIDDAHFLAHNRGKEKYIDFEKQYADGALMCMGNPVLLEQVFVNLFNNSIDAIERFGRIIVRTKVNASSNKRKNIVVEVEDNGPGIPKDILSKVFDPFYTTKETGHGTGLGLSTAFTIVERHNGHLRIDTERNSGAKFIITLPFDEGQS